MVRVIRYIAHRRGRKQGEKKRGIGGRAGTRMKMVCTAKKGKVENMEIIRPLEGRGIMHSCGQVAT
jgi:hypothetical protein